jgi:hypothetical protein
LQITATRATCASPLMGRCAKACDVAIYGKRQGRPRSALRWLLRVSLAQSKHVSPMSLLPRGGRSAKAEVADLPCLCVCHGACLVVKLALKRASETRKKSRGSAPHPDS